jgi:hypothetical protein
VLRIKAQRIDAECAQFADFRREIGDFVTLHLDAVDAQETFALARC